MPLDTKNYKIVYLLSIFAWFVPIYTLFWSKIRQALYDTLSIRQAKQINRHPSAYYSKSPSQPLQILRQTIKHHRSRRRHHNARKPFGIARHGVVALPVAHKLAKELVVDEPKMKALWATCPAASGKQYKRRGRHHGQHDAYESQHKKYPTDNQKRPTYGWAGWLVGFRPVIKGFFFGHSWASGRSDRWCGHVFYIGYGREWTT